jgi:hypothetical protein
VAAMLADVVKAAHAAVFLTYYEEVLIQHRECEIVAGLGDATLVAGELPGLEEQRFPRPRKYSRVVVVVAGKCPDRTRRCLAHACLSRQPRHIQPSAPRRVPSS